MIIRSIIPHLTFQVECREDEIEEATEIANQLADKLQKMRSRGINQKFSNLKAMKDYLEVL